MVQGSGPPFWKEEVIWWGVPHAICTDCTQGASVAAGGGRGAGGRGLVDVLAGGVGADEGDGADVGVVADEVDGVVGAVDEVDCARGEARLHGELHEADRGERHALRRLEDVGVAEDARKRVHPERYHGGEVEGGDTGADAEGLPVGVGVDTVAHGFQGFPHKP